MFEKEAEEYVIKKHNIDTTKQPVDFSLRCEFAEDFTDFQKGAEFGYNKANEWHYVKEGDLPKDEKDMLMSEQLILLTKLKGTNNLSISIGQYNFSTQEFSYQHIVGLTEVYAWKEIVLPKEIE